MRQNVVWMPQHVSRMPKIVVEVQQDVVGMLLGCRYNGTSPRYTRSLLNVSWMHKIVNKTFLGCNRASPGCMRSLLGYSRMLLRCNRTSRGCIRSLLGYSRTLLGCSGTPLRWIRLLLGCNRTLLGWNKTFQGCVDAAESCWDATERLPDA